MIRLLLAALLLAACTSTQAPGPPAEPYRTTQPAPAPTRATEAIATLTAAQAEAQEAIVHRQALIEALRRMEAPPDRRLLIVDTARRYGLEPDLLAAVAAHETGGTWDPTLRGAAGEIGVMQITPSTARWIADMRGVPVPDLEDVAVSLDWGAWYLARCLEGEGGDIERGLRCYNGGPRWETRAPVQTARYARAVISRGGDRR